jgi:hypothetical protein
VSPHRFHRWRWLFPALISTGLVAWVASRISPDRLARAAESLNWPGLAALTLAMVAAVYLWDVVCVRWLYALPNQPLSHRQAADARAGSYLWSAVNYEVGQGVLAWQLARIQNASLLASLSRCVLLAVHDLAVLLALGLAASLLDPAPQTRLIPIALASVLAVFVLLAATWRMLPDGRRQRLVQTRWGNWLGWWRWRHSIVLCGLRLVYFGIMVVYAGTALRMCGIVRDLEVVCGTIPLVLLVDALPSVSGFGTRHAAVEALLDLNPSEEAVAFHFSTFWSAGLLLGRASIGLANWWLLPLFLGAREST